MTASRRTDDVLLLLKTTEEDREELQAKPLPNRSAWRLQRQNFLSKRRRRSKEQQTPPNTRLDQEAWSWWRRNLIGRLPVTWTECLSKRLLTSRVPISFFVLNEGKVQMFTITWWVQT